MSESKRKNYKFSLAAVEVIYALTARLSAEARIPISATKALELAIFYADGKSLAELMGIDK